MGYKSRGHNQITSLSAAVTLGNGVSIAASAVPSAAGTGYAVGDTLTVSGGTKVFAAVFVVTAVKPANGAVLTVALAYGTTGRTTDEPRHGFYTATPSNPASTTTSGSGSGCTLTVTYTANAIPRDARAVLFEAETQSVRWRDDGVAPTASVGHVLAAGVALFYEFATMSNVQIIEATASAKANITFYS